MWGSPGAEQGKKDGDWVWLGKEKVLGYTKHTWVDLFSHFKNKGIGLDNIHYSFCCNIQTGFSSLAGFTISEL